ncbi:hypothetical protein Rrhod_1224 [Rhodococcus rhodnii LMG 5362]|uniref:Uncharacterized protein n=1 Tax=Rhodococcus rhodnii LMG 5362 TaxID=1273125 RepID=R7WQ40_9NOCA|nr:hypothetical protein Rrhod_1224 [Rhodococcus rhodnii LMG 5362]
MNDHTEVASKHDRGAFVVIGLAVVLVVAAIVVAAVVVTRSDFRLGGIDGEATAAESESPALPDDEPFATDDPAPNEPVLRELPESTLFGGAWTDADDTYTMAFADWPFAFRTEGDVNCFAGSPEALPDASGWTCRSPRSGPPCRRDRPRVPVGLLGAATGRLRAAVAHRARRRGLPRRAHRVHRDDRRRGAVGRRAHAVHRVGARRTTGHATRDLRDVAGRRHRRRPPHARRHPHPDFVTRAARELTRK